jgi:hypothetical protein
MAGSISYKSQEIVRARGDGSTQIAPRTVRALDGRFRPEDKGQGRQGSNLQPPVLEVCGTGVEEARERMEPCTHFSEIR